MHDSLIIVSALVAFLIVLAAAVWLFARMPNQPITVKGRPFDKRNLESIDSIISSFTVDKWHDAIDDKEWRQALLNELEKLEKTKVWKDLVWYFHTFDVLEKLILNINNPKFGQRSKPTAFPTYVKRLSPAQINALRDWMKGRNIHEANAQFLFDLLREQEAKGDNQGGEEGGDDEDGNKSGSSATGDDRPPLPNLWKWLSVWGGPGGGGSSTKKPQR